MAALRDVRNTLLLSYCNGHIDDTEFLLLFNINQSQNPDFPYWSYGPFQLNLLDDSECMAALIKVIFKGLQMFWVSKNGKIEALCILLKRLAYPCRYGDMIPQFRRSVPELSIICNYVLD